MKYRGYIFSSLLVVTAYISFSYSQSLPPLYYNWGVRMSFVKPDYVDATVGFGGHFDIGFELSRFGSLHFYPSVEFWTRGEDNKWTRNNIAHEDSHRYTEVAFNIFDVRYFPPMPSGFIFWPYAGLGPTFFLRIYSFEEHETLTTTGQVITSIDRDPDSDIDIGFDFIAGFELRFTSSFYAFSELKGKFNHYDTFKWTAGVAFPIF